jgi:hypothetical protein
MWRRTWSSPSTTPTNCTSAEQRTQTALRTPASSSEDPPAAGASGGRESLPDITPPQADTPCTRSRPTARLTPRSFRRRCAGDRHWCGPELGEGEAPGSVGGMWPGGRRRSVGWFHGESSHADAGVADHDQRARGKVLGDLPSSYACTQPWPAARNITAIEGGRHSSNGLAKRSAGTCMEPRDESGCRRESAVRMGCCSGLNGASLFS